MTIPPPFQLVDHLKTKEIVHKVSSVFLLTFSGFDTFHAQVRWIWFLGHLVS